MALGLGIEQKIHKGLGLADTGEEGIASLALDERIGIMPRRQQDNFRMQISFQRPLECGNMRPWEEIADMPLQEILLASHRGRPPSRIAVEDQDGFLGISFERLHMTPRERRT